MLFKRWLQKISTPETPTISEPSLAGERLMLEELRRALMAQLNSGDDLDSKLRQLLGSASLILAIVTSLQITQSVERIGWLYLAGLSIAFGLYVALIVTTLKGLLPIDYHLAVPPTWEEMVERYFGQDEETALDTLNSTYLKSLDKNTAIITHKAQMVRLASFLMVGIVFVLLLMGFIGLGDGVTWPWMNSTLTPTP